MNNIIEKYHVCGIYCITNLVNHKIYVGHSKFVQNRFYYHNTRLTQNKHSNADLQSDWNRDGSENFVFTQLEECKECDLKIQEDFYMKIFDSKNPEFGYNKKDSDNQHYNQESKERMSIAGKKKIWTELHKKHLSEARIKKWKDPEFRKMILKAMHHEND